MAFHTQLGKSLKSGFLWLKTQFLRLWHGLDEISFVAHLLVTGFVILLSYFGETVLSTVILLAFILLAWYLGSDEFDGPSYPDDKLGMV